MPLLLFILFLPLSAFAAPPTVFPPGGGGQPVDCTNAEIDIAVARICILDSDLDAVPDDSGLPNCTGLSVYARDYGAPLPSAFAFCMPVHWSTQAMLQVHAFKGFVEVLTHTMAWHTFYMFLLPLTFIALYNRFGA